MKSRHPDRSAVIQEKRGVFSWWSNTDNPVIRRLGQHWLNVPAEPSLDLSMGSMSERAKLIPETDHSTD